MKVIIMAGGKGTRIKSIRNDIPKPMIKVYNKPILQYQIENLKQYNLTDIILVIGYLGHIIKDYFGDGNKFGVKIEYFFEENPLGTAGALFKMPQLQDDFILMCGDLICDINFNRFIQFHKSHQAWASLLTHPNAHPYDSSLIITKQVISRHLGDIPIDTKEVTQWINKEEDRGYTKNRINAGIQIISPKLLETAMQNYIPQNPNNPDKIDLDRDILKPNISLGKIYAYDTTEYVKDMGTPERYYEVKEDIKSGKVAARNLSNKQKAIFIDRDGTINKQIGFLKSANEFILIEGVAEAIKKINQSGYLAVVITNQPVIARGDCTFNELQNIHNKMETLLGLKGAFIDGLYICPHHPDKGFVGERTEYKCICNCRKPKPGLILKAAKDLNIDLSKSYMIGDNKIDLESGKNAGCHKSLQIESNKPHCFFDAITSIIES